MWVAINGVSHFAPESVLFLSAPYIQCVHFTQSRVFKFCLSILNLALSFVPIINFLFHSALTWERYLGWIIVKFGQVALQISHSWTWSTILELGLPQALFTTFTEKPLL